MGRIIFGDAGRNRRYWRYWLGDSGNWWFEKSYRTRTVAILAAIFNSPGSPQRVVDSRERD